VTSSEAVPVDVDDLVDHVTDQIRIGGGRASAAVRPVLEALVEAGGHSTAEELADAIRTRHPDVHQSTVYRNLERFEQMGVAYHVHLGHGPALWHLTAASHHHLTCEACGAVVSVDPAVFYELQRTLVHQAGFVADFRHFGITGRCAACASDPAARIPH
jgi:Fur family ferric uptake transcriptional regulator